jgi:hypothetical protein
MATEIWVEEWGRKSEVEGPFSAPYFPLLKRAHSTLACACLIRSVRQIMKPFLMALGMTVFLFAVGCATAPKRIYNEVPTTSYCIVKQQFVIQVKAEMGWPVYDYPVAAGRYRSFISDQSGTYYYPVGENDDGKITKNRGLYLFNDGSGGSTYFWPSEFIMALPSGGVISLTGRPERNPVPLGGISPEDMKKIEKESNKISTALRTSRVAD